MKSSNKVKGNGEGYGGKVTQFAHLGLKCGDDTPADIIEKRDAEFYLIRENCVTVTATKLGAGQVDNLAHAKDLALYDSKVFKVYVPPVPGTSPTASTPPGVSRWLCRGSDTFTAYPREVVDTVVTNQADLTASVKIVRYASEAVVIGDVADIQFLTVYQATMNGSAQTETFTGQVPVGESFSLSLTNGAQPALSFSLKLGANTYTRAPQVSCYIF